MWPRWWGWPPAMRATSSNMCGTTRRCAPSFIPCPILSPCPPRRAPARRSGARRSSAKTNRTSSAGWSAPKSWRAAWLPPRVTAATGIDALTHNVESYLSPAYHPLCDGIALEGTRIAAAALYTAVKEPGDLQARSDMMMASMMGAIAFQKDLGAVHSCAHALGAVCDLHHGLANALMLDTVMAWNLEAAPDKFERLAQACRIDGGGAAFAPWLKALKARIGISGGLAAHHVQPSQLPRLVEVASQDICHRTNVRPCSQADFERLFAQAM